MFWLEWIVTPIMLFTMGKLRYVSAQHRIASHDTPLLYHSIIYYILCYIIQLYNIYYIALLSSLYSHDDTSVQGT